MGRLRRFDRVDSSAPEKVAELLPPSLRCADGYLFADRTPDGYRVYVRELGDFLEGLFGVRPDQWYVAQVAAAAGMDVSDWFHELWGLNRPRDGR